MFLLPVEGSLLMTLLMHPWCCRHRDGSRARKSVQQTRETPPAGENDLVKQELEFQHFMELKLTKPGFLVDYIIHMLTISYYIIIRLPYVTIQSHGSSPLQTVFFCVGLLMSSQSVGVMVFKEIKPQQRW